MDGVKPFRLTLPFPPSLNRLYRHVGKNVVLSKQGREYAGLVGEAVTSALEAGEIVPPAPHAVWLICTPPDRRKRDLDNLPKRLLDLVYRSFEIDDSQIIRLSAEWRRDGRAPGILVDIRPAQMIAGVVQLVKEMPRG